jgi:hypothetical protein
MLHLGVLDQAHVSPLMLLPEPSHATLQGGGRAAVAHLHN